MCKLLKNQFYIMRKASSTYILLAVLAAIAVFEVVIAEFMADFTGATFNFFSMDKTFQGFFTESNIIIILIIFTGMRVASFFDNGYAKTIADSIDHKSHIYFSQMIVVYGYMLVAFLVSMVTLIIMALCYGESLSFLSQGSLWLTIGQSFVKQMAVLSFAAFLAYAIKKTAAVIAIMIPYVLIASWLIWYLLNFLLVQIGVDLKLPRFVPSLSLKSSSSGINVNTLLTGGGAVAHEDLIALGVALALIIIFGLLSVRSIKKSNLA